MLKTMEVSGRQSVLFPENDVDKVMLFALRYAVRTGSEYDVNAVFNTIRTFIDALEDNTIVLMLRCFHYNTCQLRSALEYERNRRGLVDPEI